MSTINILWFSLSPCGSIRRYKETRVTQGWMISLEDEIKKIPNIKLSVAYISFKNEEPYNYDGVTYYPIWKNIPQNKIGRVLYRFIPNKKLDALVLPKLLKIVEFSKPDLIHVHGTEDCFGLIQNKIKNIPIVFSIQGLIAPYKEKYFSGISFNDANKYETFWDKIRLLSVENDYKSFCYRAKREIYYLSNAKYIFGRTFWDKYCTLALNPKRKYFTVNEILRDIFYRVRWNKNSFDDTIKLVSTISGGIYKGFETVLKTMHILSTYADFKFEWHIAGYTKQSKWVKISEKITGLKSSDYSIKFYGRIDAEQLSDLLISSDIYVHVSHIENSPNSVCEAMLLGMPIIASFAGGTASLLANGKEGLLYQDGDPYVLAGSILKIAGNFNYAKQMGNAAFKRAIIRHDKQQIVNELIYAYKEIISYKNKS